MYNYLKIKEFNSPLTIHDRVSALQSIQIFVDAYSLAECRNYLWKMLYCSLVDDDEFEDGSERDAVIQFAQSLEEMSEVLFYLYKNRPTGSK